MASKAGTQNVEKLIKTADIIKIAGNEYVTVKTASSMLGRSVAQIRRYAQNKAIPSQKIAKTIIFRLENVKKFTPPAIGRPHSKKY